MTEITVREHARLTTQPGHESLDCHSVSESAFKYLCDLSASVGRGGASLVQVESGMSLRVDNYVGVIHTPCDTVLEILPKHLGSAAGAEEGRSLLVKMLGVVLGLKPRQVDVADIQLLKRPLTEWVMRQFLELLDQLVKRGMRFDYREVEEEQRFLKGRLDVARQVRQRPGRQHTVHIRHEVFVPDRPENRLLRSALRRVRAATREPKNWRLANELASLLEEIPESGDQRRDFRAWRKDRLMAHYAAVKPWCSLVLGETMPIAQRGSQEGISLLFPMERLFEEYVACRLAGQLRPGVKMTRQAASRSLCQHDGDWMFQLKPDIFLVGQGNAWILDTKWKLLDEARRASRYDIDPGDVYQLLAYGYRYLDEQGDVYLIYPATEKLTSPLPHFSFSKNLRLSVVPFDLVTDRLLGDAPEFLRDAGRLRLPAAEALAHEAVA